MVTWSKWASFQNFKRISKEIPERPGIYIIRYTKFPGKPTHLQRLKNIDKKGLLYVGRTVDLRRRLRQFFRSAYFGKDDHSSGWTFHEYYGNNLKFENLEFSWSVMTKTRAKNEERKYLDQYQRRFFDRPPLNLSLMR